MAVQFTACLDANVLFQAPLRDLLLELSLMDVFQARWSDEILRELRNVFRQTRPDISADKIDLLLHNMNAHTRDCVVSYPASLVDAIKGLPDQGDRHVVAAAIQSRSHAIVTWNLKDFPETVLEEFRLQAIDPDSFLIAQYDLNQGAFMECVLRIRKRLQNPAYSQDEYIATLIRHRLVGIAALLKPMAQFI